MCLLTQSKNSISTLEMARQLGARPDTTSLMRHKLMSVMGEREAPPKLDGRVEMDDAMLGGEKSEVDGGKRGRGGPNKTPFVIGVETTDDGTCRVGRARLLPLGDEGRLHASAGSHLAHAASKAAPWPRRVLKIAAYEPG